MKVFSERFNKEFETFSVEKKGTEVLTHESFLQLYRTVQKETGVVVAPIGMPKDWELLNSVVVPFIAKDKSGICEYAIGQATLDSIETEVGKTYFASIAYNRGFDNALKAYLQIPKNVRTEASETENAVNNDHGFPAKNYTVPDNTSPQVTNPVPYQMPISSDVQAPFPVTPQQTQIPVMPQQAPVQASVQPIPQTVPQAAPQTVSQIASQAVPQVQIPTTIPQATNTPVMTQAQNIPATPQAQPVPTMVQEQVPFPSYDMPPASCVNQPAPTMNYVPQQPVNAAMDESQPGVGNPGKTVLTFGPALADPEHITIETTNEANLDWVLQNITENSLYYPLKLDVIAYMKMTGKMV